jgi:membrane protease subunit HflC
MFEKFLQNKKAKQIAVVIIVFLILFFSSIFTIDQRQQVLVLQLGEPVRLITKPGIKFKIPFIQNTIFFDKRILNLNIAEQEVIALDQKRLIINAFAKYRIIDPLKFHTTARTLQGLNGKFSTILDSSLRQVIGEVTLSEMLTQNRSDIMSKIKNVVANASEIFGIEIIDVRIMRADLPKENSDAIFARMQTEREKEAREIRATGVMEADKIRAEADKQRTIIISDAKKQSDLNRGVGDAEASRIYANAFGRDSEFADFYRSMNAYKEAMNQEKTKMIISSDGEFFKYFNNTKNGK